MGNDEASRFRELLAAERRSADLYDGLAEAARGERREILNQLAAVERRHAERRRGTPRCRSLADCPCGLADRYALGRKGGHRQ